MIKGTIQVEDNTLVNINVLNTGSPKYIKQVQADIKGKDLQEYNNNSRRLY